jgi:hypothetical protein
MDGIFLVYRNTARMSGFQYVPLREMDQCLFGCPVGGQRAPNVCVACLERLMEEIVKCRPEEVGHSSLILTLQFLTPIWIDHHYYVGNEPSISLMRVRIEPQQWDADKNGARPIAQPDVTVDNMIDDANVDGPPPFEEYGNNCEFFTSVISRQHQLKIPIAKGRCNITLGVPRFELSSFQKASPAHPYISIGSMGKN